VHARLIIEAIVRPKPREVLARALTGEVFDVEVPTVKRRHSPNMYTGDQAIRTVLRANDIPHYRTSGPLKVGQDRSDIDVDQMLVDIEKVGELPLSGDESMAITTVHVNQRNPAIARQKLKLAQRKFESRPAI